MPEEKEKVKKGDLLIAEAAQAHGITKECIFASRYDEVSGEVSIVTNGGIRVRYKPGDKVEKLDEIAVTGINPKAAKRKVIAGKPKGKEA